jgi:hypothetical protein
MFKFFVLPTLLFMVACGATNTDSGAPSQFWDGTDDVHGADALVSFTGLSFEESASAAKAIVVIHIDGIHDVELLKGDDTNIIYESAADKARAQEDNEKLGSLPIHTTYSGTVKSWIKGNGESNLLVRGLGGVSSLDGATHYPDAHFLLEPGRTYLLFLYVDSVDGKYFYGSAREGFDLTHGVKVMNSPYTRDLEHLEGLSIDDFVSYVRQVANTAKSGTNQPAQ